MKFAPIYIVTLCRYEHFVRCVESLKKNTWAKYTDVYIGLDYPPSERYLDGWKRICNYLDTGNFSNFASFNIVKRDHNFGAIENSKNLREQICTKYDRWIYSEDDLEYASTFLEYINKTMWHYENDSDVVAVTGYSYPITWTCSDGATCIKQNINCSMWGTAFWRDRYFKAKEYLMEGQHYQNLDKVILLKKYRNMIEFSQREYFTRALKFYNGISPKGMLMGATDAGLRMYLAIEDKYVVSPIDSKVRNFGFDGSGLICKGLSEGQDIFTRQEIDNATSYDCIPDTICDMNSNRILLNQLEPLPFWDKLKTIFCISFIRIIGSKRAKKLVNILFKSTK